jgi:hypothetical protein
MAVVIRTVDRVKDRAAVVGLAFLLVGLVGAIFVSPWVIPAALCFYLVWAGLRIVGLMNEADRANARGNDRLADAIKEATVLVRQERERLQRSHKALEKRR